jgi:hypothetical protein
VISRGDAREWLEPNVERSRFAPSAARRAALESHCVTINFSSLIVLLIVKNEMTIAPANRTGKIDRRSFFSVSSDPTEVFDTP